MYDQNNFKNEHYNIEPERELTVLPPGTEKNQNKYGIMQIKFGSILYLEGSLPYENTKLKLQFWGQKSHQIFVAQNCNECLNSFQNEGVFEIRCPIVLFHKYLQDMVRIKIDVLDMRNDKVIGNVIVNTLLFIKKEVFENDTHPFEDLNTVFPIIKPQQKAIKPEFNTKIGEIEISLSSEFIDKPVKDFGKYEKIREILGKDKQQQDLNYFEQKQLEQNNREQEYQQRIQQGNKENLKIPIVDKLETQNTNQSQMSLSQNRQRQISSNVINMEKSQQSQIQQRKSNNNNIIRQQNPSQNNNYNNMNRSRSPTNIQNNMQDSAQKRRNQQLLSEVNNSHEKLRQQRDERLKEQYDEEYQLNEKIRQLENKQRNDFYEKLQEQYDLNEQENNLLLLQTEKIMKDNRNCEIELLQLKMDENEFLSKNVHDERFSDDEDIPQHIPEQLSKKKIKLQEIQKMRFKVQSFRVTNTMYRLRFQNKRVFIECDIPGLQQNEQGIVYSRITLGQKAENNLEYIYNQEYPQNLKFNESNMSKLLTAPITMKILIENSNQERVLFGQGQFRLEKMILQDIYQGQFKVKIDNPDIQANNKLRRNEIDIGEISMEISLEKGIKQQQELKKQIIQEQIQQNLQQEDRLEDYGCQIYLEIQNIKNINKKFKNILMKFKTYKNQQQQQSNNLNTQQNEKIETEFYENIDYSNIVNANNFTSVFPVYSENIYKMEKMPFLIEVWGQLEDFSQKLIGIAKISMNPVYMGTTTGCNNEQRQIYLQQLKNSLFPLIVCDQSDIQVQNIRSQEVEGYVSITLAFGTTEQIIKFQRKQQQQNIMTNQQLMTQTKDDDLNQRDYNFTGVGNQNIGLSTPPGKHHQKNLSTKIQDIIVQNKDGLQYTNFKKTLQYQDNSLIFGGEHYDLGDVKSSKSMVQVLEQIRRHKRKVSQQLRKFLLEAEKLDNLVTLKEFYAFLRDLSFNDPQKEQMIQKITLTLDYSNTGQVNVKEFSKSYSSYVFYEQIIRLQHYEYIERFKSILRRNKFSNNDLERHIVRYSEFGFIQKHKFLDLLTVFINKDQDYLQRQEEQLLDNIIQILDPNDEGLILATQLSDYIKNSEIYEGLSHIVPHDKHFKDIIENTLGQNLYNNQEEALRYLQEQEHLIQDDYDNIIYIRDICDALQQLDIDISFWEALCIIDNIQNILFRENKGDLELVELAIYKSQFLEYLSYLLRQQKQILNDQEMDNMDQEQDYQNHLNEQQENNNIEDQNIEDQQDKDLNVEEIADIVQWNQTHNQEQLDEHTQNQQNQEEEEEQNGIERLNQGNNSYQDYKGIYI